MSDELDRPLGLDRADFSGPAASPRRSPFSAGRGLAIVAAVTAVGAFAYAEIYGDPQGGHARAVGKIAAAEAPPAAPPAPPAAAGDTTGSIAPPRGASNSSSAEELERASGVKVTRVGGGSAPGAVIIQLDDPVANNKLSPAPDPRLVERTRLGVLPRTGADGAQPMKVYARPLPPRSPLKAGAPRIALMVSGLGLSAVTTREALDKLPPAVTFAFAPYGGDLESDAARARELGHETVLQLPMEPIDSARDNPGPHTLRADASPAETIADLQWLMTRFPGYFAVSPFLGARFAQNDEALLPVLRDIQARGLALLDDGTASRPNLDAQARTLNLSTAHVAIRLDADESAKGIEDSLAKLEALARDKGAAIGAANALPASIDRIARFARTLEQRGILLVPVSAMTGRAAPGSGEAAR